MTEAFTREDDERDLRLLAAIEAGLPLSLLAESEGVSVDYLRDLIRELPE